MRLQGLDGFDEVWAVDFEFTAPPGEIPRPICAVARELRSNRLVRLWGDELKPLRSPPYAMGPRALFISYYSSAEFGCHLALGWPLPENVLDLYVEFRNRTNGLALPCGAGLLGALAYFGLDSMAATEKEEMRALAIRGGPFTVEERSALLDYCQEDVDALARLLPAMLPGLDLPRALHRGRFMRAAARMEHIGIPIDVGMRDRFSRHWTAIQERLIEEIDMGYGVYQGRTFKVDLWLAWLSAKGIPWPLLGSGRPALDDDTFRDMARSYPEISAIRELRGTLSKMRLSDLAVGSDARNRTLLSAFKARTSRNQPSNSAFAFGPAAWLRGLIRPEPGWGLGYIDWGQQELGIAAALSRDEAMIQAYLSGDPYLAFAVQAGAAPPGATKETHEDVRERYKRCALGTLYSLGAAGLSLRINQSVAHARDLLRDHRQLYRTFWAWSDGAVDHAMLCGSLWTTLGWTIRVGPSANPRSLRNFPVQGNGAEMLRLACCLATERGVRVCAPIHDAILIEAPLDELDQAVEMARSAMAEASRIVLEGFELRTDFKIIRHPGRYQDKRGIRMWDLALGILGELEDLRDGAHPTCAETRRYLRTDAQPSLLVSSPSWSCKT